MQPLLAPTSQPSPKASAPPKESAPWSELPPDVLFPGPKGYPPTVVFVAGGTVGLLIGAIVALEVGRAYLAPSRVPPPVPTKETIARAEGPPAIAKDPGDVPEEQPLPSTAEDDKTPVTPADDNRSKSDDENRPTVVLKPEPPPSPPFTYRHSSPRWESFSNAAHGSVTRVFRGNGELHCSVEFLRRISDAGNGSVLIFRRGPGRQSPRYVGELLDVQTESHTALGRCEGFEPIEGDLAVAPLTNSAGSR